MLKIVGTLAGFLWLAVYEDCLLKILAESGFQIKRIIAVYWLVGTEAHDSSYIDSFFLEIDLHAIVVNLLF